MRPLLFIVLVSIITCKELQHNSNPAPLQVAAMVETNAEAPRLLTLGQSAKAEMEQATSEEKVNRIAEKYKRLIHRYLVDSCKSIITGMPARVERVEPSADQVYISSTADMFRFYAYVDKGQQDRRILNAIFQSAKKLKVNSDGPLKMLYLGECEVGFFKDQFEITIKAVPVPANTRADKTLVQQLNLLQ